MLSVKVSIVWNYLLRIPRLKIDAWRKINALQMKCDWVQNGVPIVFNQEPPRCRLQNQKFKQHEALFINQEVSCLIRTGAIQRYSEVEPHCVLPLHVVPK